MTDAAVESAVKPRRRLPPGVGLAFWLILLPIALIGLGLWQLDRADEGRLTVEADAASLARTLEQIRPIAEKTPTAILRFEGNRSYTASIAKSRVEEAISDNDLLRPLAAARKILSWVTIAGGALALAGGAGGLIVSQLAGWRALRSRDQLLRSFARLRTILPVLLAAVMLGLAAAGLGATLFETASLPFWSRISGNAVKLAFAGIILAGIAAYCAVGAVRGLRKVFALLEPEPIEERGRLATRDEAPGLWRLVEEVAKRMGAEPPETIIVGLTGGFYVTESPVRVLPAGQILEGRTLHMPAPLLEMLDTTEIAAVVGHELAHFVGEDTRYSRRFVPIYSGLERALGAMYGANVNNDLVIGAGLRLGHHALSRFDAAVAHWSRLREFEADRRGAAGSTAQASASALLRSHVADAVIGHVLEEAFQGRGEDGVNLVAAIAKRGAEDGFPEPGRYLEDRQLHPTDSHPPNALRIEALGVEVDDALLARATRPPDLAVASPGERDFADWDGFCRALSKDFLAHATIVQSAYRERLQAAAARIETDDVVLFENAKPIAWLALVVPGLITAFVVLIYLIPEQMGFGGEGMRKVILTAVAAVANVIGIGLFIMFWRRASRPLMILRPDMLTSHWLENPVPWTDIVDYRVHAGTRLAVQLLLAEGAPLPRRSSFSFYNHVNSKRRMVTLDCVGIRGLQPNTFSELIGRYLDAAHARQELSRHELSRRAAE